MLSSQAIVIIVGVFLVGFLMMIPFLIAQNRRKKKADSFAQTNNNMALLHIYGDAPEIDGTSIKNIEHVRGADLQYTVALLPGTHSIGAKYSTTSTGVGKTVNYKTAGLITSDITLEAGHEYTLSIYLYSPEERWNYYKGDVGEAVFSQPLDLTGGGSGYTKAYVICYKEK